jgi:hypothetical protein
MTNQAASSSLSQSRVLNAALFATALTSVATFFLFGAIHKFTHHRPLGAATLAVMVVAVFFGCFAVSARLRVSATVARAALALATLTVVALTFVG